MALPDEFERIEDQYRGHGVSPEALRGWKSHLEGEADESPLDGREPSEMVRRVFSKMVLLSKTLRSIEDRLDRDGNSDRDVGPEVRLRSPLTLETLDDVISGERSV